METGKRVRQDKLYTGDHTPVFAPPYIPNLMVSVEYVDGNDVYYLDGTKLSVPLYTTLMEYHGFSLGRDADARDRPYYNAFVHVVGNLSGGKNGKAPTSCVPSECEGSDDEPDKGDKTAPTHDWRGIGNWRVPDDHPFASAGAPGNRGHAALKLVPDGGSGHPGLVCPIFVDMFD